MYLRAQARYYVFTWRPRVKDRLKPQKEGLVGAVVHAANPAEASLREESADDTAQVLVAFAKGSKASNEEHSLT